jgi:hypothetical protein
LADNVTKAVLEALGTYLKTAMPKIKNISFDWPNPNVALQYPCITITTGSPEFANMMPEFLSRSAIQNNKATARYEVGSYEFSLQVDIWCGSKEERFRIYDDFFKAFNANVEVMGLALQLTKYYDIFARYDLVGYDFNDGEEPSQRAEWRARLQVRASCKAILEKTQYIITQPIESDAEITDNEIEV